MRGPWLPRLLLLAILAGAAALRVWGLGWGLPNSLHAYSYHPDEFLILGAAGSVLASGFPRLYNYPSLYIYLVALVVVAGATYGLAHGLAGAYLCARAVTAIMGVAAVAVAYWAGKSLWGKVEGLLAALMLCIAPLHVQHSHFATVDVPSTLFIAACLGYAGLVQKRGTWRDYILCGVMAGLAAGTKYNAGLVAFSLIAAHFLGSRERGASIGRLLAALGCMIAAFVASTPATVLRSADVLYGLTYELHHAAQGHGLVFAGTGNGFIYTFTSSLWYGLGPGLAILFAVAAIYGIAKRDRTALVILAFALLHYALISVSQVRFARYTLPLYPAIALLIAWMVRDLWTRFPRGIRWAWAGLIAAALAGTLVYAASLDSLFTKPSPQTEAAAWMFRNVPKGSTVGVFEVPWFYSPPYSKTAGFGSLPQRIQAMSESPYRLDVFADSNYLGPWSETKHAEWIVWSDYESGDVTRLSGNKALSRADLVRVRRINRGLQWIRANYRQRKRFANNISDVVWLGETASLPHDMRYPAPTIWIYERKP